MDYRSMFDSRYVGAWDLDGRDRTVRIVRVTAEVLPRRGAQEEQRKPVVYFEGAKKALLLNKTNARTIATLYGTDTERWVGQLVTLYATKTEMAGETVDAVRVRAQIPRARPASLPLRPVDQEMRERQNRAAEAAETAERPGLASPEPSSAYVSAFGDDQEDDAHVA